MSSHAKPEILVIDSWGSFGSRSPEMRYRSRREYSSRRRSRSFSRSRSRDRSRERRRRSRTRSRSRDRNHGRPTERDMYKDVMEQEYMPIDRDREDRHHHRRPREFDRDRRDKHRRGHSTDSYLEEINSNDSFDSDQAAANSEYYRQQMPSNKIIILGLAQHIKELDIYNDLIHYGLTAVSIRLIRKRKTGASRGFAFVEFRTEEEATRWMEYKQGTLMLQDQYRAVMQYSTSGGNDWYCVKCGEFNFRRRENCFKCYASREESEKGGEGSDEVSAVLTKKIILRNLDVLTNEEGVLTIMQELVPTLVTKISKILICRDPLTSTSRGICYLSFDNLVDSMNIYNALKALEPPLHIDNREVMVSYCVDSDEKQQSTKETLPNTPASGKTSAPWISYTANTYQYTLNDVPRLAEYSANIYASNQAEHNHYYKYYTDYYVDQISKGNYSELPTMGQLGETANSGAAVALSAIQRKQKHYKSETHAATSTVVQAPKGNDGIKYATPDASLYQYDETSGFYYDPTTGLYYDAQSQYYYNSETGSYLYWDQEACTYVPAPSNASVENASAIRNSSAKSGSAVEVATTYSNSDIDARNEDKRDPNRKDGKHDKVKVAKKIVKDMEKWAKQLNQKKEMNFMQCVAPPVKEDEYISKLPPSGYADVGFSILEKKDRKVVPEIATPVVQSAPVKQAKIVSNYDDNESNDSQYEGQSERDYVDFEKLTCLLCKRAFQASDILQKHLKMSNLHKENLRKYNLDQRTVDETGNSSSNALMYRDRAKERRLKYGECDTPPPNKSRERFVKELEKQAASLTVQSNLASVPIGENNIGNKLLQKMGWTEGQGLGRSNQGRTNIIEAESRAANAGLGSKTSAFAPGDDYKSYIKRMMKARYEQA